MTTAERLLVLTLELQTSLDADNWGEVSQLLAQREKLIEGLTPSEQRSIYTPQLAEAEERALKSMTAQTSAIKTELDALRNAQIAGRAYARRVRASSDISLAA